MCDWRCSAWKSFMSIVQDPHLREYGNATRTVFITDGKADGGHTEPSGVWCAHDRT